MISFRVVESSTNDMICTGIPGSVSAISRVIWVRRRLLCKHLYVQERVPSVSLAIGSRESLLSWINRLVPSFWSVH